MGRGARDTESIDTIASATFRERTAEWHVRPLLLDALTRTRLIEEHAAVSIGVAPISGEVPRGHSPELTRVLDYFRLAPLEGKRVLVAGEAFDEWYLARHPGTPATPLTCDRTRFSSRQSAEHWVFIERVNEFLRSHGHGVEAIGLESDRTRDPVSGDARRMELTAYCDRWSTHAGDSIKFYVNSEDGRPYRADIVRIISGDLNPAGPGFKEELAPGLAGKDCEGRRQEIYSGSYVLVPGAPAMDAVRSFTLQAYIWPTTPGRGLQAIVSRGSARTGAGYALVVAEDGSVGLVLGSEGGSAWRFHTGHTLQSRVWYLVAASYDAHSGEVVVSQTPVVTSGNGGMGPRLLGNSELPVVSTTHVSTSVPPLADTPILIAAASSAPSSGRSIFGGHYTNLESPLQLPLTDALFNGKIDRPRVAAHALSAAQIRDLARAQSAPPESCSQFVVGMWDFSANISAHGIASTHVLDMSGNGLHGHAVNMPARGVTGFNWVGESTGYTQTPEQYAAIHFHDDDVDDARWRLDFEIRLPSSLRSGLYAARLRLVGESGRVGEEYVPFYVRPPRGRPSSRLAVLIPTATYTAYANDRALGDSASIEAEAAKVIGLEPRDLYLMSHPEYGGSLYGVHSDGSGICYWSRLRPILNARPKCRWLVMPGPSSLWGLNADTHLLDWLETKGIAFDVHTDEDLHSEGTDLLAQYRVVLTGSHPEYYSEAMLTAVERYQTNGGRLVYLGGNGFYWVTCFHPDNSAIIEVQRGQAGSRPWAAAPGQYLNAFDGKPGGLWRHRGRIAGKTVGLTCIAQGFESSSYYRRMPDSRRPDCAWIFDGVSSDVVGDYGLQGGGAAGLEIDCAALEFGTPTEAYLLARSEGHASTMMQLPDDILAHCVRGISEGGDTNPAVHADVIYIPLANGGAVFGVGSIAWCGSLSHNDYENDISRITENVIRGFLTRETLASPQ